MAGTVREELMASHDEFRRLAQEHSSYCQRLDSLLQKTYSSPAPLFTTEAQRHRGTEAQRRRGAEKTFRFPSLC
jgi:hypothetical protein